MIKYHGTPFGGSNSEASEALIGKHAFISFAAPTQLDICLEVCQSIALDNGAFSAWRKGKKIDWVEYFNWVNSMKRNPKLDFAIIPDVIDGDEESNNALIGTWRNHVQPKSFDIGVPVWHMHESMHRLKTMSYEFNRIAIGSSAEYSVVGNEKWHQRMREAMYVLCDENGYPRTKIHMLRGLNTEVFTKYPFASADSTNAGRNCNLDNRWKGTYPPPSPSWKARVIMARIESFNAPCRFIDPTLPDWLKL